LDNGLDAQDTARIVKALEDGVPANDFKSGLKFIGRVHSIRKIQSMMSEGGVKVVNWTIQGIGFDELSTTFFYDPALASHAATKDVWQFLSQIGLDQFQYISEVHKQAGVIKDNAENFFDRFIDIVVGKGAKKTIDAGADMEGNKLSAMPQVQKEAPFAYLIPLSVATTLGRTTMDERKGDGNGHGAYGYADVLTTLTGVQKYEQETPTPEHQGFVPKIGFDSSGSSNRLRCPERIKGTYIPIEPVFINASIWSILNQFKNPTVNEMYTCIRPDLAGDLMPTIVFRQIPFSTESIKENPEMQLTRFLSLPRWVIPGSVISNLDVGRSNATHFNFIHVYGQVSPYYQKEEYKIQAQMARNAPIMDTVNVAAHGLKPYMSSVACCPSDIMRDGGARVWMEAIADWTMGSQHTLNGRVTCKGVQSPIAEGDNVEIDGIVFHVEGVTHSCGIKGSFKFFETNLTLTNGMPVDQSASTENAPHYAGFGPNPEGKDLGDDIGDDEVVVDQNPGITVERAT
jgi:hypothetical protein